MVKGKTIKQVVVFRTAAHEIYEALMDENKHAQFTGDKAVISREVGGKFSVFDGYGEGANLELIADRKIVQTWRAYDWPKGYYSRVAILLKESDKGTRLTFTQTGVPEEHYNDIYQGWRDYYWIPLKKMLE